MQLCGLPAARAERRCRSAVRGHVPETKANTNPTEGRPAVYGFAVSADGQPVSAPTQAVRQQRQPVCVGDKSVRALPVTNPVRDRQREPVRLQHVGRSEQVKPGGHVTADNVNTVVHVSGGVRQKQGHTAAVKPA